MNDIIELKKTPLHGWHVSNGAKMGVFGEWAMPLSYGSETKEWRAVREKAGLFDVSHMGVIVISGADAGNFVRWVTTNDVGYLDAGDVQYTLLCKGDGGILDDVTVYKMPLGIFFFVVNASNAQKIYELFLRVKIGRRFLCSIFKASSHALSALQGPCAEEILSQIISSKDVPKKRYTLLKVFLGQYPMFISRTGYTGEDGFEIFCYAKKAQELWEMLLSAGKPFGLLPCGLVARDMLRTEAGMRLYGNDIDETTNPIEAGLEKFVSFSKGDFIGKSAIEKAVALRNRGGGKFFTGFVMDVKPEHGCPIFESSLVPDEIGTITSATYSPLLKKRIALGYLRERKNSGEIVYVKIGEDYRPATVTALPFYSRKK